MKSSFAHHTKNNYEFNCVGNKNVDVQKLNGIAALKLNAHSSIITIEILLRMVSMHIEQLLIRKLQMLNQCVVLLAQRQNIFTQ